MDIREPFSGFLFGFANGHLEPFFGRMVGPIRGFAAADAMDFPAPLCAYRIGFFAVKREGANCCKEERALGILPLFIGRAWTWMRGVKDEMPTKIYFYGFAEWTGLDVMHNFLNHFYFISK